MRTRLLLSAVALGLVVLLGAAGPAGAAEDISHAAEECIELLEEGGEPEDCHEAPNPILPEPNEIIWGGLSFLVLFALLWKFGFPAVQKGLAGRTERIRSDVETAEAARQEAEAKVAEYDTRLTEARQDAARIIEDARQDADAYRTERRAEVDAEVARLREQAQADVESSKAQALADMRGEIAALAIGAAEQVVGRNLDREANEALVDQFIDSVGSRSAN